MPFLIINPYSPWYASGSNTRNHKLSTICARAVLLGHDAAGTAGVHRSGHPWYNSLLPTYARAMQCPVLTSRTDYRPDPICLCALYAIRAMDYAVLTSGALVPVRIAFDSATSHKPTCDFSEQV
eukprot:3869516-Rhodomonas_salina.8